MSTQLLNHNSSTSAKYRNEVHQHLAEGNALSCLLNCYIREYGLAKGQVELDDHQSDIPATFNQQISSGYRTIRLSFPESAGILVIKADYVSLLARVRFISQPYLKRRGLAWQPLDAVDLAQFLLEHLAVVLDSQVNLELLEQIKNSINITRLFIQHNAAKADAEVYSSLIQSEQSLLWGHAMHPAPKSRDGVSFDQLLACSPEVQAKFALHWFEVSPQLIKQMHCTELTALDVIEQVNPSEACLYPCHPWEVQTILKQPLVQKALQLGLIRDAGPLGEKVYPTSSVRTLFVPQSASFMKFSIHVRLTNCVRKNAWYELQSAVTLTGLLRQCAAQASLRCPKFSVMEEPAASSIDLSSIASADEQETVQDVIECFGILYRDGLSAAQQLQYQPQMAQAAEQSYAHTAELWFDAYLQALLPGVLHYFFNLGIAFEPHLQNTVIGFENGLPAHIWIRDLEGTKLMQTHWPADKLSELSEKARASVYYSREQGWNRIAYCTLINNISEAIFHIAAGSRVIEASCWSALAAVIEQWQSQEGEQPELQAFLAGQPIPSKNNLTTRLLKQADSLSGYSLLSSPLAQIMENS
ncbi:IucA/IucC family protein [Psychromonas aquimarina]|uniref:IucA/IucC family protein n=1 Tax=Psychromonas aquimarina TaxID=444919 RepID=UPI00040471D1|nr:IucA/IucC family protein [Psychromonas aquimarina]